MERVEHEGKEEQVYQLSNWNGDRRRVKGRQRNSVTINPNNIRKGARESVVLRRERVKG